MTWPNTTQYTKTSLIEFNMGQVNNTKLWDASNINLPWFTNSGGLRVLIEVLWGLRAWFAVLIDEMLLWDWSALVSISTVLELQISSDTLDFLTGRPWIFSPFDGSSTAVTSAGLVKHPRQPLLCFELGLTTKMINTPYQLNLPSQEPDYVTKL